MYCDDTKGMELNNEHFIILKHDVEKRMSFQE